MTLPFIGCVPVATGVITYNAAVSHQESAAYAGYIIEMQDKNNVDKQAGRPILSEEQWLKQIQQPRIEYAEYYSWSLEHGVSQDSLVPFEKWTENEREKFRSAKLAEMRKKNPYGSPSQR
jgi:hypothetical protein